MEAMSSESEDGEGCCRRLCRRGLQWASGDRSEERTGLAPQDSLGMERKGEAEEDEENVARMAGYLEKKGKSRLVSIWHRYWFVLEGQRLMYYEMQPRPSAEIPPPSKGTFMLIPPTSVTVNNSSRAYNSNHLSYHEIYILTPSQLVTLRTKDVDQHKLWMQALLTSIAPSLKKETEKRTFRQNSSVTTSLFPHQPSTKHFRYSLSNLATVDEKTTAWPAKSSHTMDNRNSNAPRVKCGSADDIIDRYQERSPSVMDEDTSSEEDGARETLDNTSFVRSDDDVGSPKSPEYCLPIDHNELPFSTSNEKQKRKHQLFSEEHMEENPMYGDFSDKSHLGAHLIRHNEAEKNSGKSKVNRVSETKQSQSQESKLKSRKFFGMKESKRHDAPTKCQKKFAKSKEPEMTHRPSSPQKMKSDQDVIKKLVSKDDIASEDCARNYEEHEVTTDSMHGNEHLQQTLPTKPSTPKDPEPKSSKKAKKKKKKNTKEGKGINGDQPMVDIQSDKKSKISKDGGQSEETETKKNRKKKGFFSKMLKGKKNENQEDRSEESEEKQQVNNERNAIAVDNPPSPRPELLNENIDKAPLEMDKPVLITPKIHFGMKMIPTNDAELKRKLESRFQRIEAEQNSSSEMKIPPKPEKKLPVPTPRVKNGATNKLSIPVIIQDDSNSEDQPDSPKPLLPPRMFSRPPPSPHHDKPSHYLRVIPSSNRIDKSNLQDDDVTYRLMLPGKPRKFQTSEVNKNRNSSYDQVKVTGKKLVNISGKSAENTQQAMNSELRVIVSEYGSVPQSEKTGSTKEEGSVSEIGDGSFCRNLQEVNDTSVIPSVDFDTIQYSIHSPSQKLQDSMVNCKSDNSATRDHSPNYSNNSPILETVQVPTLKETSVDAVQDVDVGTGHVTALKEVDAEKVHIPTLKETSDDAVHKVDELGLLLSELDRINSSPLEGHDSRANPRPISEEIKRVSILDEDFLTTYPIRRRRNSDPDYDIPRPHRLPRHHLTNPDGENGANGSSQGQYDDGTLSRQGVDSIKIEATCFFGPGMDCSFNENRYFGLDEKNNKWDEKNDDKIEVMNYMDSLSIGDYSVERCKLDKGDDFFGDKANVYSDSYCDTYSKEKISEIDRTPLEELKIVEKANEKYFDMTKENVQEEEESVLLRGSNIDRVCRTERSREVYECDIEDIVALYESVEGLPISRTQGIVKNPETACSLALTVTDYDVEGTEVSLDVGDKESSGLPEDMTDSIKNETQDNFREPSSSVMERRNWHEEHGKTKTGETEVFLRQKYRSDDEESARRDHRTLRLSFATTETLIVEEEVLVATLKTTTTTTTTLPSSANDAKSNDNKGKQKVEEFVEEVVLDLDNIEDDHFGNMQVQSCVQT